MIALLCFTLLSTLVDAGVSQLKVGKGLPKLVRSPRQQPFSGAIFDIQKSHLHQVFSLGVQLANNRHSRSRSLEDRSIPVQRLDALNVTYSVCSLFSDGVVGIFGPADPIVSPYVQALCDKKEIPHVEFHWDNKQTQADYVINLHPHPTSLSKAVVDLVKALEWFQFTVIYEDDSSLPRVEALLGLYDRNDYVVTMRQLELVGDSYRSSLARIKKSGETHFVVDCSVETLEVFLDQAQQVGILTEDRNFIFTNLDFHTLNTSPYQYSGANITGVRSTRCLCRRYCWWFFR